MHHLNHPMLVDTCVNARERDTPHAWAAFCGYCIGHFVAFVFSIKAARKLGLPFPLPFPLPNSRRWKGRYGWCLLVNGRCKFFVNLLRRCRTSKSSVPKSAGVVVEISVIAL